MGGGKKLLNCARERIISQMDPDMVAPTEAKAYLQSLGPLVNGLNEESRNYWSI